MRGFISFYAGADEATSSLTNVSLWVDLDAAKQLDHFQPMLDAGKEFVAGGRRVRAADHELLAALAMAIREELRFATASLTSPCHRWGDGLIRAISMPSRNLARVNGFWIIGRSSNSSGKPVGA